MAMNGKKCVTFCTPAKPCYKCRYNALVAELAQAHAEAAVMVRGLEHANEYARHKPGCTTAYDSNACSCGWLVDCLPVRAALSPALATEARKLLERVAWLERALVVTAESHGTLQLGYGIALARRSCAWRLFRAGTDIGNATGFATVLEAFDAATKDGETTQEKADETEEESEIHEAGLEAAQEAGEEEDRGKA